MTAFSPPGKGNHQTNIRIDSQRLVSSFGRAYQRQFWNGLGFSYSRIRSDIYPKGQESDEPNLYTFLMMESWKFSKGLLLTVFMTGLISFLVLGFAYQQNRSSEILTGVIGGLTIILGMITAEWLRSCREQVEVTRIRSHELLSLMHQYLFNFEEFMQNPYSKEHTHHMEEVNRIYYALRFLTLTTRWPQPNAGKIRDAARILFTKLIALQSDAEENGHIWSLEKRMPLMFEVRQIAGLIWMRTAEEIVDFQSEINNYRESPKNDGLPFGWTKSVPNP